MSQQEEVWDRHLFRIRAKIEVKLDLGLKKDKGGGGTGQWLELGSENAYRLLRSEWATLGRLQSVIIPARWWTEALHRQGSRSCSRYFTQHRISNRDISYKMIGKMTGTEHRGCHQALRLLLRLLAPAREAAGNCFRHPAAPLPQVWCPHSLPWSQKLPLVRVCISQQEHRIRMVLFPSTF